MEYEDFTIDVESVGAGRFQARVADAPRRDNPRDPFRRPLSRRRLDRLLASFDQPLPPRARPIPSPLEVGQALHSALFSARIGELFDQCRAGSRPGIGLRLRLRFRWDDNEANYLAALPWEWLCSAQDGVFLGTDRQTPIVREIAAPRALEPLAVTEPLRILVVEAAPSTKRRLNLQLETERMERALKPLIEHGQVDLQRLTRATAEELCHVLVKEEIHILHFMGHSGYHAATGYGAVFLERDDETHDQVDGIQLAEFLNGIPSLRLVVLNACQTARLRGGEGAPLCDGVASALLQRTGVPAVIANQCSISDDAAIQSSHIFYSSLAAGLPVDAALTEVRIQLKPKSREWATPVLFLSAQDGNLFSFRPTGRTRPVPVSTPATPRLFEASSERRPLRLGIRSRIGHAPDLEAKAEPGGVLDLTRYFDDRYIRHPAWWQERIFPELRIFLKEKVDFGRPLVLDFAAHASIAFAAGWLLEPKSGLDVSVSQRTPGSGELPWHPKDGTAPDGPLWLERPEIVLGPEAPDVGVALAATWTTVAADAEEFIRRQNLPIGRLIEAAVAPEPGHLAVRGGAHSLRLAQALLPLLRPRHPHERGGRVHFFGSAPNAMLFYLGQLASSLGRVVLYEFPFGADNPYGRYQKSIELPPPGEVKRVPDDF